MKKFNVIENSRFLNPMDLNSVKGGCSWYNCPVGGPYVSCTEVAYHICGNGTYEITTCARAHITCGPVMWYKSCSLVDESIYASCGPVDLYAD